MLTENKDMSAPIPKFASFKPKKSTLKADPKTRSDHDASSLRQENRKYSRDRSGVNLPEVYHVKQNDKQLTGRAPTRETVPARVRPETASSVVSDAFAIDTTGDPKNLEYGSLHRYSISKYYRDGSGSILGLRKRFKIDRDASSTSVLEIKDVYSESDPRQERLLYRKSRAYGGSGSKRLINNTSTQPLDTSAAFVPLADSHKRSSRSRSSSDPEDDHSSSDGAVDVSDIQTVDESVAARKRQVELIELTKANPQQYGAWQKLIEHQAELVAPSTESLYLSTAQQRAIAEMRLPYYEQALHRVASRDRSILIRAMVDEGCKVWHKSLRMQKLCEYVDKWTEAYSLWVDIVDLTIADDVHGTIEDVKSALTELLSHSSKGRRPAIARTYVLSRLLSFLREAGYHELAVAIWQCALSLHTLSDSAGRGIEDRLSNLARQWDDEELHYGDNQTHSTAMNTTASVHSVNSLLAEDEEQILGPFARFAEFEMKQGRICLPGRTSDEIEDDAFHVVLFQDMQKVLEALGDGVDAVLLFDAFAAFFDLPQPCLDLVPEGMLWRTSRSTSASWERSGRTTQENLQSSPIPNCRLARLFHEDSFPKHLKSQPALLHFIRTCILKNTLSSSMSSAQLHTYLIAFEAAYVPDAVSKTAKMFLKATPNDLNLYNAAALAEARLGHDEKANRIWATTISSHSTSMSATKLEASESALRVSQRDMLQLAHDWAWISFDNGNREQIMLRLSSYRPSAGGSHCLVTSSMLLALEDDFWSGLGAAIHVGDADGAILYASALCLLKYTTAPEPVQALISCNTRCVQKLKQADFGEAFTTRTTELIYESIVPFLLQHLRRKQSYSPSIIRSHLSEALHEFPCSQRLLIAWYKFTLPLDLLDDRLRNVHRPWLHPQPSASCITWAFAIDSQLTRYFATQLSGNKQVIRSMFSRCLLDESSKNSQDVTLWYRWLDFELRLLKDDLEYKAASIWLHVRAVFLDGLRAMRFNRNWILKGLRIFDWPGHRGLSPTELKHVYDLMIEREMRVREEMN